VETAEDASYLLREGVDLLQGYYFGKPQMRPPWKLEAEDALYAEAESEPAYRLPSQHAAR
jgi:EAL domain-containing protein (putative c-di-GMP-specific phosphodiesterase class I)